MSKIHVLPDENLGGVLREYVEVDRAANVGDKIVIVNPYHYQFGVNYTQGAIMTVTKADEDGDVYCGKFNLIDKNEYQTLEPTDIVRIKETYEHGKWDYIRYRLVDRKAKVGEKIIIVKNLEYHDWFKIGEIAIVEEVDNNGNVFADFNENERVYDDGKWCVGREYYRVLEPVEPAEEGDNKSVLDLLANLAHRLTTLEQQVTRRVTELEKRVRIIDEYNDVLIDRMNDVEEKIEKILDDIVTLDERTQPLVKSKTPSVAVKTVEREFDRWSTRTKVDAYVLADGFRLEGTFEFDGVIKNEKEAAKIISEVFK
jgi:hypothetical protein